MPTMGCHQRRCARRAEEPGVTEGEDPAVRGDLPVAPPVGGGAMPTMGLLSGWPPIEPSKRAAPKAKMPPSEATIQ